jgi:NitT/TauT family transport system permease protein
MNANSIRDIFAPLTFGVLVLAGWEVIVRLFHIPPVLLPAPSAIAALVPHALPMLGADVLQTVVYAALPGWMIGSLAGLLIALVCDRVSFLRRGLLPLGNFLSALPLVGVAPIMVMWYGSGPQSKIAVVVIMTFFPMLVNAVAGLQASGHLERDLMRSYGADWLVTLIKLRLPAAMPFIFNALKINSTLAMIGAIVAEFFGSPIVGMGFRISTGAGSLSLDLVWAEIAVAALAGSAFYGLLTLTERWVTFWHPSYRR